MEQTTTQKDDNSNGISNALSIQALEPQPQPEQESQSISISIQALEPQRATEPQPESQTAKEPQTDRNNATEPQQSKNDALQPEPQSQSVTITESINTIEKFISFMNKEFNIPKSNELIVLIQRTELNVKGYYSPNSWSVFKHQQPNECDANLNINKNIHEITLSSLNLIFEPYETIAHEYAHFLNTYLDLYKGNCRNYHTLDFKKRAEQLLLRVEKGIYGYNQTYETDAFKEMVLRFQKENPDSNDAFKIFQPTDSRIIGIDGNGKPRDKDGNIIKPEPKSPSRLILYTCSCGVKIRTARNKDKPLNALCLECNTPFKEVVKPDGKKTEPDAEPESNPEDDSNHREPITPTEFNNIINKGQRLNTQTNTNTEPKATDTDDTFIYDYEDELNEQERRATARAIFEDENEDAYFNEPFSEEDIF